AEQAQLAGNLSHGQKQWLEIGMLLAQDPKLLLVDEPVAGMTDVETHQTAELLKEIQAEVGAKYGKGDKPFYLVFHGGSGSTEQEIADAVSYGVIKMNIDTDTQYAFTRPVAGHMFSNYDGVLKVDGEVGNKKMYDPRSWGKKAEAGMAKRVVEACENLRSAGHKM
ncbi:MAG: class II fructose-bisphosphate aldolase, partial [Dermabacter sp.]|nr:class II fructose-bisphosphate aldolase [Dermabacter sp.]